LEETTLEGGQGLVGIITKAAVPRSLARIRRGLNERGADLPKGKNKGVQVF